jgi:hypothetical protein
VARELGVRYVLEGSVRKAGGRVRITAQLIDALSGTHLWAEHFDGSLEDVFDLQDKVAIPVAGIIEPALQAAETTRSAHRPTILLWEIPLNSHFANAAELTLCPSASAPARSRATCHSAVDHQLRSRHVVGGVGSEEQHAIRDVPPCPALPSGTPALATSLGSIGMLRPSDPDSLPGSNISKFSASAMAAPTETRNAE